MSNNNDKKGKGGVLILIVLLIAAVAVYVLFFTGGGNGSNSISDIESTPTEVEPDSEETTDIELQDVEFVVSESSYMFEGENIEIEDIKDILANYDNNKTIVIITDDNATLNSYNKIKEEIEKLGFSYQTK